MSCCCYINQPLHWWLWQLASRQWLVNPINSPVKVPFPCPSPKHHNNLRVINPPHTDFRFVQKSSWPLKDKMLAGLPGCDQEKWRWTFWSLKSTSIMKTRCRWRQVTWNRKAVNPPDSWSTKCAIPFLAQVADILHTSYHIISKIEIYWSFAALLLNT